MFALHDQPSSVRYAGAAAVAAAALGLRLIVMPIEAGYAFITFYPGVAAVAALCGLGPALFFIALATGLGAYVFLPATGKFGPEDVAPPVLFIVSALGILFFFELHERRMRTRSREIADLEDQSRVTFEQAPVGIAHVSADGIWLRVNPRLCELLGYSHEELERIRFRDITHPEDLESSQVVMARLVSGEQRQCRMEKRYIRKDGSVIWASLTSTMLYDSAGTARYTVSIIEDITAHRHAEQQLLLAAKVFQRAGKGVMITDRHSRILTVNDAFTRTTGYTLEDAVGATPAILKSGRHPPDFYGDLWHRVDSEGWWQGEIWNRRRNGEIYSEWLTINVVRDPDGTVAHYVAIFSDISAIRAPQRELL